VIVYEYPLNERVRTLLRLEDLFDRVLFFIARDSAYEHHAALVGIFEILEVASRGDLKSDLLQELDWMRRHCGRLVWLNPLLRFDGYAPLARGAAALHARVDGMLAVHNLEKLEGLATSLARTLAR
jgi:uncharacterized protein with von Willebrand factor type A (vWA) domain